VSRDKLQVGHPCPVCPRSIVDSIDYDTDEFACSYPIGSNTVSIRHTWEDYVHAVRSRLYTNRELVTAKIDTRFPHQCPRCKQTAYVGLNQIEHRDADRDRSCK
jgi:hypothetical protein